MLWSVRCSECEKEEVSTSTCSIVATERWRQQGWDIHTRAKWSVYDGICRDCRDKIEGELLAERAAKALQEDERDAN